MSRDSKGGKIWLRLLIGLGLFFLVAMCLLPVGAGFLVEATFLICFGWIVFLFQALGKVRGSSEGILQWSVCMLLFAAGLHWVMGWLYGAARDSNRDSLEFSPSKPEGQKFIWPVRWTLAVVTLILFAFVAGISMVGITHQVAWLARSSDPWLATPRIGYFMSSENKLKQIAFGAANHADEHSGEWPTTLADSDGRLMHSWQTMLLCYVENQRLFEQIDLGSMWNDPANQKAMMARVAVYQNQFVRNQKRLAADENQALTDYSANMRLLGGTRKWKQDDISDGASHTILAGEIISGQRTWGDPRNTRDPALGLGNDPRQFGGPWSRGVTQFALADGSIHSISPNVDARVLRALATPAGGETVSVGDFDPMN